MYYGTNIYLQIYRQEERELIHWLEMQRKLAEASGSPLPTRSILAGIRQRLVLAFRQLVPGPCACPAPECIC